MTFVPDMTKAHPSGHAFTIRVRDQRELDDPDDPPDESLDGLLRVRLAEELLPDDPPLEPLLDDPLMPLSLPPSPVERLFVERPRDLLSSESSSSIPPCASRGDELLDDAFLLAESLYPESAP